MFTGIIEEIAEVVDIKQDNDNKHFVFKAKLSNQLKVDQSLSHNGVCLTVVHIDDDMYTVTAIDETLKKTNLNQLLKGSKVNIERAMIFGSRIDGHLVQGHVDQTAICTDISDENGSYIFTFEYSKLEDITVEKGSICVNGVSLTVVDSKEGVFSVAIIPYTYENTNFNLIQKGSVVNLEFDVLGKYVTKILKNKKI
tara:strand:- start:338 stop:928 length:591 start_codon:yes stop_codon:yes gene_type:complete